MAENSAISWTDDTFNPWEGCQKVGPGCDGCYAEARNIRYAEKGATEAPNWGPGAPRRRTSAANWRKPLKWNREQEEAFRVTKAAGIPTPPPRFVFCASLADVFDNAVDPQWRRDLFDLIRSTPHLTWLLLTKRPGNIVKLYQEQQWSRVPADQDTLPVPGLTWPSNAAIGCTVVNQDEADRDVRKLLEAKRDLSPAFAFLSMEPLLGPVDLRQAHLAPDRLPRVDWVITGGETDQGDWRARPANPDWFRSIRDQCAQTGVAYHHKQNGEWAPGFADPKAELLAITPEGLTRRNDGTAGFESEVWVQKVGKGRAGRLLDGIEHNARPEVAHG